MRVTATGAHNLRASSIATLRQRGSSRRGGSIIQMVFVLQLLLWVTMGMAEYGQYFYIKSAFQAAARDVARASILSTANTTDPGNVAVKTLALANVTFNPSWLTITDITGTPYTVTDVSAVAPGHVLQVTIQVAYNLIPNVYRPLNQITGQGIKNGKLMIGQSTMIRE